MCVVHFQQLIKSSTLHLLLNRLQNEPTEDSHCLNPRTKPAESKLKNPCLDSRLNLPIKSRTNYLDDMLPQHQVKDAVVLLMDRKTSLKSHVLE